MARKVTVRDGRGPQRISIPKPAWRGSRKVSAGVHLTAIYLSPNATPPRIVLEYDSCWQAQDGGCVGQYYVMHTPGDPEYADVLARLDRLNIKILGQLEPAQSL